MDHSFNQTFIINISLKKRNALIFQPLRYQLILLFLAKIVGLQANNRKTSEIVRLANAAKNFILKYFILFVLLIIIIFEFRESLFALIIEDP